MACDVPLTSRITGPVDRRLRMLALLKGQPLSHVLDGLLDEALPPAEELASQLGNVQPIGSAPASEAAA
jgi:hypothetical protein